MKAEHAAIRLDIGKVEMNLRGEIAALRSDVGSEIATLRSGVGSDIATLRSGMALLEQRMMIRLSGMMVVAVGVLLAAIRYLHP